MPVARGHLFFWVFLAVSSHSLWAQLSGPSLVYSTYLSGPAPGTAPPPIATEATAIAVDASGNAYVTGQTESSTFPVTTTIPAGLVPSFANPCVFVTKLSPQGALAYSTLLGGALQQVANGIAVDSAGNAYITGHTSSSDFPTVNALQAVNRSGQTAFVAKLNATGTALVYSTYLGGSTVDPNYGDIGLAIGVDAAGNAYVAGATSEADFPTVNGIPASGSSNLRFHGFLSKLNTAGSALIYSTFLGSGPNESVKANSLAVDAAGNAYVGGQTIAGFPTANPIQANYQGGPSDGFVLKMDPSGALVYSTYLGGNLTDAVNAISVDAAGDAVVCGVTASPNFPVVNAFQATQIAPSGLGSFVAKLNPDGSALVYSSYMTGYQPNSCNAAAADPAGNAYFYMNASPANYPASIPLVNPIRASGGGTMLAKLSADGSQLLYSTGLGGYQAAAVATDGLGNAYVAGWDPGGADFPQMNALPPPLKLTTAATVAKINDAPASSCSYNVPPNVMLLGDTQLNSTITATLLVTANMGWCPWSFSGNPGWYAYVTPVSGNGIGTVTIAAGQNPGETARTGTSEIAGFPVQITQEVPSHADAGSAAGVPGQVARVPVTITLQDYSYQTRVTLTVVPNDTTPAVSGALGFQPDPALPAPAITPSASPGSITLTWGVSSPPFLTGVIRLGELLVPIPDSASLGQTYSVNASGAYFISFTTYGLATPFSVTPGSAGELTVSQPSPVANWLLPSSAAPGSSGVNITVNGEGFSAATGVLWNGSARPTTFVSETQVSAGIPASDLTSATVAQISVTNPGPGGGSSQALPFTVTTAAAPAIHPGGVVNSADFGTPVAGGSIVTLFGNGLASSATLAQNLPLPFSLGDSTVRVDGIPAPLLYVSPGQINFQMPGRTLNQSQASVVVSVDGRTSAPVSMALAGSAPAIYTLNAQGTGQGAILDSSSYVVIAPANSVPGLTSMPGVAKETISIFATGLGALQGSVTDGTAAVPCCFPYSNVLATVAYPQVTIGGVAAEVDYSGLAPNYVGLYQINAVIPSGVAPGNAVPVVITMNGVASNTATIAIQ